MHSDPSRPTTGMVLGKFMPPHLGHVYLFDFARRFVDRLAIVIDTLSSQPIPGELRYSWLREMYPDVEVFHLTEKPQEPSEHPDFWRIWRDSLLDVLPFQPDFIFGSEAYGWKLADELAATFVPVDVERSAVPVSGTVIRQDPLAHWQYLPRTVRPHFVRRICVFGPESTGKSTLTRQLAEHFHTVWVPEYARTHLEPRGGDIGPEDIPMIARGQVASEDALALNANRLLFCDTDLILTTIWSDRLYDECPQWIRDQANCRHYDLYLLTDVDVPWVDDAVRYLPEDRRAFLETCENALISRNRRFVRVSGSWDQRFRTAVAAVEKLLV